MKHILIILTALLLLSSGLLALSLKDGGNHTGIIRLTAHSVYLDQEDGSYLLLLTPGVIRDSIWIPLEGEEAVVNAYQEAGKKILEVRTITDANGITQIRDNEFRPLHEARSIITVSHDSCIGCNMCPRNCPVGAITMVNRKAVIDPDKCVECGACIDGLERFRGCPVRAIKEGE